ncbi:antimicrobial peptide NK-lysin-like [Hipposideros larvatus]
MTSWALLLLASAVLGVPGLAFSRLTPESYDPAPANLCDGEQSCHGLTQDDPQGDLPPRRARLGIACGACKKIIQKLVEMVGDQPDKDSISEAASRVCGKVKLLSSVCRKIMKTALRIVSNDIMAGKTPRDTCVDIKICKPKQVFI